MEMRTLVFGASLKEERYSNMAVRLLRKYNGKVLAVGGREGEIEDVEVLKGHPDFENIHTITLYMGPSRQEEHKDYLMGLSPKRVIFNPGTENPSFEAELRQNGVEVLRACTLVMLRTEQYFEAAGEEE